MILELAILDVKPGEEAAFESDFTAASAFISGSEGYRSHQLQRCLEKPNRYILLVTWASLEAHVEGFRNSALFAEWKKLLHHYYDPAPDVKHYSLVYEQAR